MEITQSELLQDVIPLYLHRGHVTVLAGEPDIGKTRFLLNTLIKLSKGEPGFWGKCPPAKILFFTERTKSLIKTQLVGMGINTIPENFQLVTLGDMKRVEYQAKRFDPISLLIEPEAKHFHPDIIVLDTMSRFMPPAAKKDVRDYFGIGDFLLSLQQWTYEKNVALTCIHHTSKQKKGEEYVSAIQKVLGTQNIAGSATAIWFLTNPNEDNDDYRMLEMFTHARRKPPILYFDSATFSPVCAEQATNLNITATLTVKQSSIYDLITDSFIAVREIADKAITLGYESDIANVYKMIGCLENKKLVTTLNEPFKMAKRIPRQ